MDPFFKSDTISGYYWVGVAISRDQTTTLATRNF